MLYFSYPFQSSDPEKDGDKTPDRQDEQQD